MAENTAIIYVVTDATDYLLITADSVPTYLQKGQIESIESVNEQSVIITMASGRKHYLWVYSNVSGDVSPSSADDLAAELNTLVNP